MKKKKYEDELTEALDEEADEISIEDLEDDEAIMEEGKE